MRTARMLIGLAALAVVAAGCGGETGRPATTQHPLTTTTDTVREDADAPRLREQPQAGTGWRLLLDHTVGRPYEVNAAITQTQLDVLWQYLGQHETPPVVDFAGEIVVHFGAVYSGSCPEILMERVVIDGATQTVYAEFGRSVVAPSPGTTICTDDANPRAYVVAVERTALPGSQFTVQLDENEQCKGCRESETMRVDLDAGSLSRHLVPTLDWEEARAVEFLYKGALVGTLRYDADHGCPWLETEGGPRSIVWLWETRLHADPLGLRLYDRSFGTELRLTGGRAIDDVAAGACGVGDWTWIATEIDGALDEPTPPPREKPEAKWDPYYTPVVFTTGEYEVEIDRWPWALLDDSGWTIIRENGEVIVEAPTAWMGGGERYMNPYTGELVVELENLSDQIAVYVAELENG